MLSSRNINLKGAQGKFKPKYLGPFKVLSCRNSSAKLELPATLSRLHPVFHTSLLKPFVGTPAEDP